MKKVCCIVYAVNLRFHLCVPCCYRRRNWTFCECCADSGAPLGFEPEGSCSSAFMEVGGGSHSPPPYLRWARNLHSLLEDPDGVQLFKRYLKQEGQPHADTLDFWFACEGLKKQDPDKINQLVKVIYRSASTILCSCISLYKGVSLMNHSQCSFISLYKGGIHNLRESA
jgi:hypothetical protein